MRILSPEIGRCAFHTILEILHFSLFDKCLLLPYEVLLLKFGFFLDMVLLHLIFNILETHSGILFLSVNQESFAEVETSIFKVLRVKVVVHLISSRCSFVSSMGLEFNWLWAAERRFHREYVGVFGAKFSPDGDSCRVLLRSTIVESRVVVREVWLPKFGHQKWKDSW